MADLSINDALLNTVIREYKDKFGEPPQVMLRSPGRINLIGEHTDYNQGFVMPSAVSHGMYMALGESPDCTHDWHALDMNEHVQIGSDALGSRRGDWSDFIHGAWLSVSDRKDQCPYFRLVMSSDLPIASGMSSSSALTCGVIYGLNALANAGIERSEVPLLAYKVEREFIGVRGGIMDQYASVLSEPGQLLLIDCRDNTHKMVTLPKGISLFLVNSMKQRQLASSDYNKRSDECQSAVSEISKSNPIDSLRDLDAEGLHRVKDTLNDTLYKRALHVISENNRVMECLEAIREGNLEAIGQILYEGHESLRDLFEVSTPELDFIVDFSRNEPSVLGARMMGAGFGGSVIHAASAPPTAAYQASLIQAYEQRFGITPQFIAVKLTGGTVVLDQTE